MRTWLIKDNSTYSGGRRGGGGAMQQQCGRSFVERRKFGALSLDLATEDLCFFLEWFEYVWLVLGMVI